MENVILEKANFYFDELKYNKNHEEFGLFIKVSEFCNLKCSFCYQNSPEGTMLKPENYQTCFDNIDYYIEKIKEYRDAKQSKYATLNIVMFGGEPTTNPAGIKAICEHLNSKYYDKEEYNFIELTMTTNGILYNPEITKYLYDAFNRKVGIMISCDFNKINADQNRKIKGQENKSAYETALENIKLYKADKYISSIKLSSVLTEVTEETKELYFTTLEEEIKEKKDKLKKAFKSLNKHQTDSFQPIGSDYDKYLKEYADLYFDTGKKLIEEMNKENYIETLKLISEFYLINVHFFKDECFAMSAIDSNGNFNFCNTHKLTLEKKYDPEKMKSMILNDNYKKGSYPCSIYQDNYGHRYKTKANKELLSLMYNKIRRYPLDSLMMNGELEIPKHIVIKINKWIEFSEVGNSKITIHESMKRYIYEENLSKVEFLDFVNPFAYYVDSEFNIYPSILLQDIVLNNMNNLDSKFNYFFVEDLIKRNKLFETLKTEME